MRKTIEIILTVLTVLLFAVAFVSCRRSEAELKQTVARRLSSGFSCTAQVTFDGRPYTVNINRSAPGQCKMAFTQPAALSSLSFEVADSRLAVRFSGLEAAVSADSLPQSGIFKAVLGAMDGASAGRDIKVRLSGRNILATGRTAAGAYSLLLAPDLTPRRLEFPALKLRVDFSNFQFS